MLVQTNSQLNSYNSRANVSFKAQKLLPLCVKAVKYRSEKGSELQQFIPRKCFFTELDKDDIRFISTIRNEVQGSKYGARIISNFVTTKLEEINSNLILDSRFFVLDTGRNEAERVKAMSQIIEAPSAVEVKYLQSVSEYARHEDVVGAGTAMLYCLCKLAQKLKKEYLYLTSDKKAFKWYEKLGMNRTYGSNFYVESSKFGVFLTGLEKRLGISTPKFITEVESLIPKIERKNGCIGDRNSDFNIFM